jgi:uridine kinase
MNKHRVSIPENLADKSVVDLMVDVLTANFKDNIKPVIVSFGGTGGVGKSTLTKKVADVLGDANILPLDDYKTSRAERSKLKILGSHPAANRFDLLHEHLEDIQHGREFERPVYNSVSGEIDGSETYVPTKYNLIDGEISTYSELYHYADMVVFIEAAFKTQLKTRFRRDVVERGSSHVKVVRTFVQSNLIDYHRFGVQAKNKADILLYCHDNYEILPVSINRVLLG